MPTLSVNGKPVRVDVAADTTILWTIHCCITQVSAAAGKAAAKAAARDA